MKAWIFAALCLGLVAGCGKKKEAAQERRVKVERADLTLSTNANGSVAPLNEVRILPPVAGRIESIVAAEGSYVKRGDVLAWMSSVERAALLDGARSAGPEELAKWEQTYKPTSVLAPVAGTVIARNVVGGQTVNSGETLFTLSDRLIVLADVDEADLGKVYSGQLVEVGVDAYPGKGFKAKVSLISQSSIRVNNVITYKVRLEPQAPPHFLRAGMTANVRFIEMQKLGVLSLPLDAVQGKEGEASLQVMGPKGKEARNVVLGENDGARIEVRSGLGEGEEVVVGGLDLPEQPGGGLFSPPKRTPTTPPARRRGQGGGGRR